MNYVAPNFPRRLSLVLALVAILSLAGSQLMAQSLLTGDVAGTVSDPTGAVISNAPVTLTSLDRGDTQTSSTNAAGYYRFALLKPGQYSVVVSQSGFKKIEQKTAVSVGQTTTL